MLWIPFADRHRLFLQNHKQLLRQILRIIVNLVTADQVIERLAESILIGSGVGAAEVGHLFRRYISGLLPRSRQ